MSALGESSLPARRAALVRAAWAEAHSCFEAALVDEETVEALEGLGVAARWQMDGPTALESHERGYRLASRGGRRFGLGAVGDRAGVRLRVVLRRSGGERLARTAE